MKSSVLATYALDTNVFISAFWVYLLPAYARVFGRPWPTNSCGRIVSIDKVLNELTPKRDKLYEWAQSMPGDFFVSTETPSVVGAFERMKRIVWAREQYTKQAAERFAAKADGSLVAYAMATEATVVTEEARNTEAKSRVLIPNVCDDVGVNCINTFSMLSELGIVFNWQEPKRIAQP